MIKVLHIGFSHNPGGVENVVMNYFRTIDKQQFLFHFADIYGDGIAFSEDIRSLGGTIFTLPNYKKHPFEFVNKLIKAIRAQNYDILHIHMQSLANILPVFAARKVEGVKIICHSHSSSTPSGAARRILHRVNACILKDAPIYRWACGKRAGNWMWGKDFSPDDIIPNAIDCKKYQYNEIVREELKQACGFEKDCVVVGFVGRFGEEKNPMHLLDVLEELLKLSDKYRLLTIGGNDLYDQFLAEADRRNLTKYAFFAGVQSNVRSWYSVMDAFLLPSFFEGFPLVGVEAQAAGLPCYFADTISEEIKLAEDIHFLPIGENTALQWAKCINNTVRLNRKNTFDSKYDITQAVKMLESKYRTCLIDAMGEE